MKRYQITYSPSWTKEGDKLTVVELDAEAFTVSKEGVLFFYRRSWKDPSAAFYNWISVEECK